MPSDKIWSRQVVDLNKQPGRTKNLSLNCWSKVCPDFIHYNSNNFTIWADFDASNMRSKNGTYLYLVEYYDNVAKSTYWQTYTLVVKNPKAQVKTAISITEPFDVWY